ncbi:hypothetical protein CB1_000875051 [Camelus ferus]|nr:hypothetical protein CB1_000875051 [Camelus ferus]
MYVSFASHPPPSPVLRDEALRKSPRSLPTVHLLLAAHLFPFAFARPQLASGVSFTMELCWHLPFYKRCSLVVDVVAVAVVLQIMRETGSEPRTFAPDEGEAKPFCDCPPTGQRPWHFTFLFPARDEPPVSLVLAGWPGKVGGDWRLGSCLESFRHRSQGHWTTSSDVLKRILC